MAQKANSWEQRIFFIYRLPELHKEPTYLEKFLGDLTSPRGRESTNQNMINEKLLLITEQLP